MGNLSKPVIGSLAGIAAALLVLIGSTGPWAKVWFITVSGLDGDGKITAALALICGGLLAYRAAKPATSRWIPAVAAAAFAVCLIFGLYYLVDLQSFINEDQAEDDLFIVQVGWGLYVLVLGALGGIAASIASLRTDTSQQSPEMGHAAYVSEV